MAYHVIERDDAMVVAMDVAQYFAPFEEWTVGERWACEAARGRVLDVGCGPGRHAVELRGRGLEVLGLEPSPGAVAIARERGVEVIDGVVGDVEPGLGSFDTILLGGQNLGLLESRERGPEVLSRLAAVTAPGGVLLGVGFDPSEFASPEMKDYAARNLAEGRFAGQQRVRDRYFGVATHWYDYLWPTAADLHELVDGTPWSIKEITAEGAHFMAVMTLKPGNRS
ncbi:class I SAM-dependent methyltransferase [Kitasatospora brasiliensis]|uniref:class I SAM-dependent methyltransferase n=1 Tax=Kitasatospora brasiliensis TaxID=3058040 RepID=UPI00292D2E88|nr:class I SAM-dependent methyltransferase [Kitasatospora sp. K002]